MSEPHLTPQISAELLLSRIEDAVLPPIVRKLLQLLAEHAPPGEELFAEMKSLLPQLQPDSTDADLRHWLLYKATPQQGYAALSLLMLYRGWLFEDHIGGHEFARRWQELLSEPTGCGVIRAAFLRLVRDAREHTEDRPRE